MYSQLYNDTPVSGSTWNPVLRLRRLWALLLVVVLASNSMFMMVSQAHASAAGETVFVEIIDKETMVDVSCADIHCNLFIDATIDALPIYIKDKLEFNLIIGAADFIFSPLRKPPRSLTV
jgi:hypothetical protein